jgi:hypothetical protein
VHLALGQHDHGLRFCQVQGHGQTSQTGTETQIVADREAYLGQGRNDVGRRIADDQVELFVAGDVGQCLQQEFAKHLPEFIALHDIGTSASLRLLGSLANAAGARVQRLSVRRQGHGVALAVLQFVEVPLADGTPVRVYSTDVNADGPARAHIARVLLAYSRLGVLMVGELPPHALTAQLKPLHDALIRGPWPNRDLSARRGERELAVALHVHRDHVLRAELALQDQLGHRVLDALLDRALERPRTEHRVEADLGQFGQRLGRHLQLHLQLLQPRLQQLELDAGDASMFFWSSAWNTTVSSMRFRNSGRKCALTSPHTASRMSSWAARPSA